MQTMTYKTESKVRHIEIWGVKYQTKMVFLNQILRRMKAGYSPIVGIHGMQRGGKTFLGLWLAYQIYKITGKDFIPEKITFYDPERAMVSLSDATRDVVLIDEASDVMDYQEWRDATHRALRSMVNTQGYKNNLYIFIAPFRGQIDRSLRVHVDYTILVTKRGTFKVWKYIKKYDADELSEATKRYFLDYGCIKMADLPGEIWDRYLHYSIQEKEKIRINRLDSASFSASSEIEKRAARLTAKHGVDYGGS